MKLKSSIELLIARLESEVSHIIEYQDLLCNNIALGKENDDQKNKSYKDRLDGQYRGFIKCIEIIKESSCDT